MTDASDDLTRQLADELSGLMLSNGYYSVQLDSVAALAVARAVLASGLVVPTDEADDELRRMATRWANEVNQIRREILDLAQQYRGAVSTSASVLAAELRAITRQENQND